MNYSGGWSLILSSTNDLVAPLSTNARNDVPWTTAWTVNSRWSRTLESGVLTPAAVDSKEASCPCLDGSVVFFTWFRSYKDPKIGTL